MKLCFYLLIFIISGSLNGQEVTTYKTNMWEVETYMSRYSITDRVGEGLLGSATTIQVGNVFLDNDFRIGFAGGLVLGPYERVKDSLLPVDMSGTIFSILGGYNLTGYRNPSGGWGLESKLSYTDLSGRSNQESDTYQNSKTMKDYSTRVRLYSAGLRVGLSFLKESRPQGNEPNDLLTRLEGFRFSFGLDYMIQSFYRISYIETSGEDESNVEKTGKLQGYAIVGGVTAVLGI